MVFLEYESFKTNYLKTQRMCEKILEEQERLFTKTQPNAIRYDKDKVQGGFPVNNLDQYMIEKEKKQIDGRLKEAKQLLKDRKDLLILKEQELRESKDTIDIVYVFKYIENVNPEHIALYLNYSKSQIYRIIEKIEQKKKGVK